MTDIMKETAEVDAILHRIPVDEMPTDEEKRDEEEGRAKALKVSSKWARRKSLTDKGIQPTDPEAKLVPEVKIQPGRRRSSTNIPVENVVSLDITAENFAPYGEVIPAAAPDTVPDVSLDLSQGTPRFYVMKLQRTGMGFHKIARHVQVTQCLGSIQNKPWYMAVTEAADLDNANAGPTKKAIRAFRIPGDVGIKLHKGTWHAGPLFGDVEEHAFYNLELKDTNKNDFQVYDFGTQEEIPCMFHVANLHIDG